MTFSSVYLISLLALVTSTVADPTDWVSVPYVVGNRPQSDSSTSDAQMSIIRGADTAAKGGPWTVTNSKGVVAPSGDQHDYLSWAPYHWPDCNWCSGSRFHLVHDGNSTNANNTASGNGDNDAYEGQAIPLHQAQDFSAVNRRMIRVRRKPIDNAAPLVSESVDALDVPGPQAPLGAPTVIPVSAPKLVPTSPTTTAVAGSSAAPQAAGKTCTPSPTKTLAPSATWTTCSYVPRDGNVNPDVRTLNGPGAINSVSQAVLYGSVCFALQGSPALRWSQKAAEFIDGFFLNPTTKMNPNMNFGQIVRGPGAKGRQGTFTGILDLRGMVKICNGVSVLKAAGSPHWTAAREKAMQQWMSAYSNWLTDSALGKSTASRANNHATFYVAQVAAVKMYAGDMTGATKVIKDFAENQLQDQIAASGEQPLEAIRTRPYHYRCFNLEALITLAKIADQLGFNLWDAKSKYGSTIQTAVDFVMRTDPQNEDVAEVVPHVAAIAAACGDPKGKYAAFMARAMPNYKTKPFYFYNQPEALSQKNKRSTIWAREGDDVKDNIPWKCPRNSELLPSGVYGFELDNGVYVSCDELEPLYGYDKNGVLDSVK